MTTGYPSTWKTQTRTPKKRTNPEKGVQKAIQDAFRLQFQIALVHVDPGAGRVNGGGRFSCIPAGFPDLIGIVPPIGRFLAIEVKAPGNRPTDTQLSMLDKMRSKGAIAFYADSVESALRQFQEQRSLGVAG